MLRGAGLSFITDAADIDERAIAAGVLDAGGDAREVSLKLAREKSLAVGYRRRGCLVIGADQTLDCEGKSFDKPATTQAAVSQILQFAGKAHSLYSSVSVTKDGIVAFEHTGEARLQMMPLSREAVERYVDKVGNAACASVGGYQIEGPGIQLFERIDGDYFTILGLPLLPLLQFLRTTGLHLP